MELFRKVLSYRVKEVIDSMCLGVVCSFDQDSNREVTSLLIRNELAVTKVQHDFSTIKSKWLTHNAPVIMHY